MDRYGGRYSTPHSLPCVSRSSGASTIRGLASDFSEYMQSGGPSMMSHMHASLPGAGHAGEGGYGHRWRQPQIVQHVHGHGHELPPARRYYFDRALLGGVGWAPLSPGWSTNGSSGRGSADGFAYCLDRGNGQVTRLIPADMLPPLNEIPAREADRMGLVVLPPLQAEPPRGVAEPIQRTTVKYGPVQTSEPGPASLTSGMHGSKTPTQGMPRRHTSTTSFLAARKSKVYCDKWIHEGVCAFTQQGCRFKHEMPTDEQTQRSLGLFQGLPSWWRRGQGEPSPRQTMPASALGACSRGNGDVRSFVDALPNGPPARERTRAEAPPLMSPLRQSRDDGRLWSAGNDLVPFIWGPIGAPARKIPVGPGLGDDNARENRVHRHGNVKHAGRDIGQHSTKR